jgi:hypothetical protein
MHDLAMVSMLVERFFMIVQFRGQLRLLYMQVFGGVKRFFRAIPL